MASPIPPAMEGMGKRKKGQRPRMDVLSWTEDAQRKDVKHGKFSQVEKDKLREAVLEYAAGHNLPEDWFRSGSTETRKGAVTHLALKALPNRTRSSIYSHLMRMWSVTTKTGPFTAAEDAQLRAHVAAHGTKRWRDLCEEMGRVPSSCRDRWRHLCLGNEGGHKQGKWEEHEEQQLVQLVQSYMDSKKDLEEAASKAHLDELAEAEEVQAEREGGLTAPKQGNMLRRVGGRGLLDGVDWDLIARQMGFTRNGEQCRHKWYGQLSPSMVQRGDWGPGDDKRMLLALQGGGYEVEWQVPWAGLVAGRTEQAVRRRWQLMLKMVQGSKDMEFVEVVDHLVESFLNRAKAQEQQQQQQQQQGRGGQQPSEGAVEKEGRRKKCKQAEPQQAEEQQQQLQQGVGQAQEGQQGRVGQVEGPAKKKRKRAGAQQQQEEEQQQQQGGQVGQPAKKYKRVDPQQVEQQGGELQEEQAAAVQKAERKRLKKQQREKEQQQQQQLLEEEQAAAAQKAERKRQKKQQREEQQRQQQQQQLEQLEEEQAAAAQKAEKKRQKKQQREQQQQQLEEEQAAAAQKAERKRLKKQQREAELQQQQQQEQQPQEEQTAAAQKAERKRLKKQHREAEQVAAEKAE